MALPTDTEFTNQWHLRNTGPGLLDLHIVNMDGVTSIWDDYTGAGVDVFVFDDGFDYTHSDLSTNYDTARDFDYALNTSDAIGTSTDSHGTAVMGIIGAELDGTGAVGVAYGANMIGIRDFDGATSTFQSFFAQLDTIFTDAAANGADVINISQGLANVTSTIFAGDLIDFADIAPLRAAIDTAVDTGRGGLGANIVKSAGNSRLENYDTNASPWSNNTQQTIVAAVDQDGTISNYSSFGASVLVSGFGTPGEVVTTDRVGADGYDASDFTSTFNGTSSAAPMVSGVVALMMEANSDLGWRDVQDILAYSSRHVGSVVDDATVAGSERTPWHFNSATDWNGGGLHYSMDYGYGLVDAHAAVRMAEVWQSIDVSHTSANEIETHVDGVTTPVTIPDGNAAGTSFILNEADNISVERVVLEVEFDTTFLGDLEIYITSPNGVEHLLIADQAGPQAFDNRWFFESQAFRGETSSGDWTVRIVDNAAFDIMNVQDIDLRTYGHAITDRDHFVVTEEFADYAGISNHGTAFNGGAGTDTLNAVAVYSDTTINLQNGSGIIDGLAITNSGIERVYSGDGNDTLTGSTQSLYLNSGRGNDTIVGGALGETIIGGAGADQMYGYGGDDVYDVDDIGDRVAELANQGYDTVNSSVSFVLAPDVEELNLTGTGNSDGLGNGGANIIRGNDGNNGLAGGNSGDLLIGGAGNDSLDGQNGSDIMRGGTGSDGYHVDRVGDVIEEDFNGGEFDIVRTAVSITLPDNVEILIMKGGTANPIDAIGNDGITDDVKNLMLGNGSVNSITTFGGRDVILGLSGDDTISAGAGRDNIAGGVGADTLTGGTGDDLFNYTHILDAGDTITDFSTAEVDVLDLRAMFDTFAGGSVLDTNTAQSGGYLNLVDNGNSISVQVDADGGGDNYILLALLQNVTEDVTIVDNFILV